jgi:signal transduction histidine kinase/ligand-binding sensor domain-containing protein
MRQTLLHIIFIFLAHSNVNAQPATLYFEKITVQNGLSHNKVNCILQDKRGFIWLGTDDGLNRFDGTHFTVYKNIPGSTTSISGNIITDMLEDEHAVLWIATADGGMTKYDYRLAPEKQFKQYKHLPGDTNSIPVNIINKLVQDGEGYLWLATSGSYVLRFNKKTEQFIKPVTKGTKTIMALTQTAKNEIWAGRQGGGLLKINTSTLQYEMDSRYNDLYAKLPHAAVTSLFKDSRNNIWYGSWDKVLYCFNHKQQIENVYEKTASLNSFNNDEIDGFAEDNRGNIWMAGKTNGLHVYSNSENKFYNYTHNPSLEGTIAGNRINCVFIDRQGTLWLGTNKGISVSSPLQQQFTQVFLPQVAGRPVTIYDFYEQPDKSIWIGTSDGIYIWQQATGKFKHQPLTYKNVLLQVSKFYKDAAGRFFIGTNYSLFLLNPQNFTVSLLPGTSNDSVINQIIKSHIVSIAEDSVDGSTALMVAPYGHYLCYYNWQQQKWVSRLDTLKKIVTSFNIKDNLVRKIFKLGNKQLFIATAKEGLGRWNRSTQKFIFFKNDPFKNNVFSNNNIYDVAADAKMNLWVTTFGGGLHYFNTATNEISHIKASNNLLEGMQTDKNENVWMISNGNIDKYSPQSKSYTSFQLPDIEKSGGVQGNMFKDAQGKLYVGGTNYFIAFNPLLVKENKTAPKVFLTDFKIFNQSYNHLLFKPNISLPYNQNYITIEFAAPGYTTPLPVQYQYKLTGLHNKWIDIGTENKVSFSNLAGRAYQFKVRATNRPGVWSNNEAVVAITIVPPVWQRWWFYFLCALFISAVIYALYRYRINELLKRQAIRNKIAQDLHDNIGSTLSSISVYSQVAKIYKQQNKDVQLQETLQKISETSGEMISEMNDIVWTINPRNDNMEVMLQRMQSFAKPLLAAKDIVFHFTYEPQVKTLSLEMTQRKNFYLIFKEAINNVLKYAACKNLYVNISSKHQQLEMIVQDDGIGFDKNAIDEKARQSLSGNGLHNMALRAKEMKGICEVTAVPGKGSKVHLQFPVT